MSTNETPTVTDPETPKSDMLGDDIELNETPETTDVENEIEVEPTNEQTNPESTQADTETDTDKAKPGFDKERQVIQQEIGNRVRPLEEKIDQILASINAQGGKVTPEQKQELVEAKSDLAEIADLEAFANTPDEQLDLLDPKVIRGLASGVVKALKAIDGRTTKQVTQATEGQREQAFVAQREAFVSNYSAASGRDAKTVHAMLAEFDQEMQPHTGIPEASRKALEQRVWRELEAKHTSKAVVKPAPTGQAGTQQRKAPITIKQTGSSGGAVKSKPKPLDLTGTIASD
jgi:hypothetical protein